MGPDSSRGQVDAWVSWTDGRVGGRRVGAWMGGRGGGVDTETCTFKESLTGRSLSRCPNQQLHRKPPKV